MTNFDDGLIGLKQNQIRWIFLQQ